MICHSQSNDLQMFSLSVNTGNENQIIFESVHLNAFQAVCVLTARINNLNMLNLYRKKCNSHRGIKCLKPHYICLV